MFSRTIYFQRYVFQTTEEIKMIIEDSTIEDIVNFLKKFFYFECEKELRRILTNECVNNPRLVHISVKPSDCINPKCFYGKEKPTVINVGREVWERDEDDGYWLVLAMTYKN